MDKLQIDGKNVIRVVRLLVFRFGFCSRDFIYNDEDDA